MPTQRDIHTQLCTHSQLLSPLYAPLRASAHLAPLISKFESLQAPTVLLSHFDIADCTPSPLHIRKRSRLSTMRWWRSGDGAAEELVAKSEKESVVRKLVRGFERQESKPRRGTDGNVARGMRGMRRTADVQGATAESMEIEDALMRTANLEVGKEALRPHEMGFESGARILARSKTLEMDGGRAGIGCGDEKRLGNTPAKFSVAGKESLKSTATRSKAYTAKEIPDNLDRKVDEKIEGTGKSARDIKHGKDVFPTPNISRKATPSSLTRPLGKKLETQGSQADEQPAPKGIHVHEKPPEQPRLRRDSKIADRVRLFDRASKPLLAPSEQMLPHVNPANQTGMSGIQTFSKRKSEPMAQKPPMTVVHQEKASTPDPLTKVSQHDTSIIQNPRRLSKLMDRIMLWENISVSSVSGTSPTKSSYSNATQSTKPQSTISASKTVQDAPYYASGGRTKRDWGQTHSITTPSQAREESLDLKDTHDVIDSLEVSPLLSPTNSAPKKPWHSSLSQDIAYRNPFSEPSSVATRKRGPMPANRINGVDGSDETCHTARGEALAISEAGCRLVEPKPVRMVETVRLMQLCAKFGQTVKLKRRVRGRESGEDEMF